MFQVHVRKMWRRASKVIGRVSFFVGFLLGGAGLAVLGAMAGGLFDLPAHLIGTPGSVATSGAQAVSFSAGQAAVSRMTGGEFELQGGFFGAPVGGPTPSTATSPLDPTAVRYDAVTGRFLGYSPDRDLEFEFTSPMNAATFARGILLELIEQPFGVAVSTPVLVALAFDYSTATHRVKFGPPSGSLEYNATYRLRVTTQTLDVTGLPFYPAVSFQFSTLARATEENLMVAADAKTSLVVPSEAAPADFFTVVRLDPLSHPERMDVGAYQEATRKAETSYDSYLKPVGESIREFAAYDASRNTITGFQKPVTVELPYRDADQDGIVDGSNPPIRVKTLAVWSLDESRRLWVRLPNPVVDTARQVVYAQTPHLSAFALIGAQDTNLDFVRVYPIPFRPNAGDPARYGRASEGVHFDNLPDSAEITIFTLTGRRVKRILHQGIGEERWLGDNEDGQKVASGVYRYLIRSGKNTKVGKVLVIW